jgi:hypothetical protein
VEADARTAASPAPGRDRDVDSGGGAGADLEMRPSGGVRQNRAGAACQHGGHPIRLGAQRPMADRVDAAMEAVEALSPHALRNPMLAYPEAPQLFARHNAELPPGQHRQTRLELGLITFRTHPGT